MKACTACAETKPLTDFYKKGGRCKPCERAVQEVYRKENWKRIRAQQKESYWADPATARAKKRADHEKHRESRNAVRRGRERTEEEKRAESERIYYWKYGMTYADRDAMLAAQGGVCALCGTDEPGGRGWCTDHDHSCCPGRSNSCGECIRGILCFGCNTALGNFKDDPVLLQRAIEYVQQHKKEKVA